MASASSPTNAGPGFGYEVLDGLVTSGLTWILLKLAGLLTKGHYVSNTYGADILLFILILASIEIFQALRRSGKMFTTGAFAGSTGYVDSLVVAVFVTILAPLLKWVTGVAIVKKGLSGYVLLFIVIASAHGLARMLFASKSFRSSIYEWDPNY